MVYRSISATTQQRKRRRRSKMLTGQRGPSESTSSLLRSKTLYPFQTEDVEKLVDCEGALIANDMGSGKTIEAIALDVLRRKNSNTPKPKTLVVCPLSSVETTWYKHYTEQTSLKVCMIDPKARGLFLKALKTQSHDVYIVHWDVLRLMPELQAYPWYHVIADECQRAQNRKTQQTIAFKKVKGRFRTALSGTPVTNRPNQYWSILNWLYPHDWRSYWSFYKRYVDYEIIYPQGYHKVMGVKNETELLARLKPFYTRHMKKQKCCEHHPFGVMPELPDKLEPINVLVDLTPSQRKKYKDMNKEMVAWVGEHEDKPLVAPAVIAKLVRLQQFAIADADIVGEEVILSEPSSKLDAIMEIIKDNENEQFVVFSQFSKAINLLAARLRKAKVSHTVFTGDTKSKDRAQAVADFQSGKLRVFCSTIKTGGSGLDLFAASTVIFIDRDWSPGNNLQAEDRLHRDGQKNPVQVINIVARGTVDAKRNKDTDLKWGEIKKLLGDA